MHVVVVSEYVRPWPGGISEHVFHQAEHLRQRGVDVTVVSGPGPAEPGVVRLGPALGFTQNGAANRLVLSPRLVRMGRLLEGLKPDVVHVHGPLDPSLSLAACLTSPVPVVGTFHASFQPSTVFDLMYRGPGGRITRRALGRIARCIAVSDEAERSIRQYFDGEWIRVPNGVDVDRFGPPEQESPHPTALFLGRADPRKGLDRLLRVWPTVAQRIPRAKLAVVGAEQGAVARLMPDGLPPSVEVHGVVPAAELPGLVASSWVLAAPSTGQESQGIVLLEGLAAGRTVLCSDIAGYRYTVGDVATRLPLEDGAWADALSQALAGPPTAAEVALRRGRAADFSWPSVASRLLEIYRSL